MVTETVERKRKELGHNEALMWGRKEEGGGRWGKKRGKREEEAVGEKRVCKVRCKLRYKN